MFGNFQAIDQRDKVFALIGVSSMAEERPDRQVPVDYKLVYKDAFGAATLHILKYEQNLDVIGIEQIHGETAIKGLPNPFPTAHTSYLTLPHFTSHFSL